MKKSALKKCMPPKLIAVNFICMMVLFLSETKAQQFNSDSWIVKSSWYHHPDPNLWAKKFDADEHLFSFPKWEFTMAAYLYNDDGDADN